jgi:phasin family protein
MSAKPPVAKSKPAVRKAAPAKARPVAADPAPKADATTIASPPPAIAPVVEPVAEARPVVEAVVSPPAADSSALPAAVSALVIPFATALNTKEPIMATAFETTQEAVRTTVNTLNAQTETAINNGKAAMEQVAAKSKEAVEASMKSLDELTEMSRANIDALIASAKVATAGVEQVMTHLTEASKKSFEDTTAMMKGLAAAKTPNELMQLQSDFAKAQFDNAVAEYSKLSEMMVKLAGDVMEPVQNQMAVATDKLKAVWTAK